MTEYLESVLIEYYTGSAWADITAYVVGDIKGNNGLGGWKPDQRVAVLGTLNITLNNKSNVFSPMGGDTVRGLSTLTGFNKGAKIRVRGVFNSIYYVMWLGRIASINSDDLNWGNEQVRIMAVDYMQVPVNYPMKGATRQLAKTIDEVMALILARLSLQPEATDFDAGTFEFVSVFDNVLNKTMALSEFTKLANSELGYIYIKQDGTLRVENFLARQGWRALDEVWAPPDTDSFLLLEDGGFLLLEDGGKIILDEGAYEDVSLATDAEGYNILLSEDSLLNASIIRAYPVITDTSLKVLYTRGDMLAIPSGRTKRFSAHYTNPSGYGEISGTNMQAPVATTDYLANTKKDGSGTNKTADIVVTATYYADTVYYEIENNAGVKVFITFLQARGYGLYFGNSVESTIDDSTSQAAHGYAPFQFSQKYQKDTYLAEMYGLSVIEEYKNPKSRITNMKYLANLNKNHMLTFLTLSIGSLFLLTEDRSNISNHYYVTDRAFTIKQGGIINVEYGVKQNDSYLSGGINPVTVEFAGGVSTDAINYGSTPEVWNISQRTFAAWIYLDADAANSQGILAVFSDSSGAYLSVDTNRIIKFYQKSEAGSAGVWTSPNNSVPLSTWTHVVVVRDSSTKTNQPIIYINGVSQTVTEAVAQSDDTADETGCFLIIGNLFSESINYTRGFNGKIFDTRIHNRILTAAEVTTLYNAGTPDETLVTDGLVFQGPGVYSDIGDDASLAGTVLSSTDRLIENIVRAVGIPHNAPVIRANP